MESFIIKEGALNDDILMLAESGKIFKGGYVAIIEYYVFRNEWANDVKYKKFRSEESLNKFLKKNYPLFEYYA